MELARSLFVGVALAASLSSCVSDAIRQSDRETLFGSVRLRKSLSGDSEHDGTHAAVGWTIAHGETNEIDFTIQSVNLGLGVDGEFERGWLGAEAGLAWHRTHFDTTPELSSETMAGPYGAVQGGWLLSRGVEIGGRVEWSFTIPEASGVFLLEGGPRLRPSDWASVFVGWRYTGYDIRDLDTLTAIDEVELDTSGPIAVIELSF